MDLGTFFNTFVGFGSIFLFYILPWLLMLMVYAWIKDWMADIYHRWKRAGEAIIEDAKKDRWLLILHITKIIMFLALLLPIISIIDYLFDDTAPDPGQYLFNETMFYVFIIVTLWYILATVIQAVYIRSQRDVEESELT